MRHQPSITRPNSSSSLTIDDGYETAKDEENLEQGQLSETAQAAEDETANSSEPRSMMGIYFELPGFTIAVRDPEAKFSFGVDGVSFQSRKETTRQAFGRARSVFQPP